MPNLSDLPYEIRLLIWEAVLHQSRNVYINMREYPVPTTELGDYSCGYNNEDPVYICSTPTPVLLHICHETRALALAHYEIVFGHAHYPHLQPAREIDHGFVVKGKSLEAEEDTKHCPRIYLNYECDTVVFGRRLRKSGSTTEEESRAYFPLSNQFDNNKMQAKIQNMAVNIDIASSVLLFLNLSPGSERFSSLKNLYLYIESDDVRRRPRRVVELVDLKGTVQHDGIDMAQRLLERFKSVFGRRGVTVAGSSAQEALKIICKDGLGFWHYFRLRESLSRNGANPDEILKCVWLREVNTIQSC
jgi:hypothetical protein